MALFKSSRSDQIKSINEAADRLVEAADKFHEEVERANQAANELRKAVDRAQPIIRAVPRKI